MNAEAIHAHIPGSSLWLLDGTNHYTFLGECGWGGRLALGELCDDTGSPPRADVLPKVADDALAFFDQTLRGL